MSVVMLKTSFEKNSRGLVIRKDKEMNIFGILGILVLLSGIGYGVILVLILMENLK